MDQHQIAILVVAMAVVLVLTGLGMALYPKTNAANSFGVALAQSMIA
jgi:uncharacterized protein YjeT (DUF2065 family)